MKLYAVAVASTLCFVGGCKTIDKSRTPPLEFTVSQHAEYVPYDGSISYVEVDPRQINDYDLTAAGREIVASFPQSIEACLFTTKEDGTKQFVTGSNRKIVIPRGSLQNSNDVRQEVGYKNNFFAENAAQTYGVEQATQETFALPQHFNADPTTLWVVSGENKTTLDDQGNIRYDSSVGAYADDTFRLERALVGETEPITSETVSTLDTFVANSRALRSNYIVVNGMKDGMPVQAVYATSIERLKRKGWFD